MHDEHATDQQADAVEEPAAGVEGVTADASDSDVAAAVDEQAEMSSGAAAEAAPEVPDDASAKIAAAQEHIDGLDMDEERAAAKRVM